MMKKRFPVVILCLVMLLCLGFCLSAAADDVFEVSGTVLTVRFPEGTEPVFGFLTGNYTMEPLAEGETADGITTVSYILPEEARSEAQLFGAGVDVSGGAGTDIREMLLSSDNDGNLIVLGESQETPEYMLDYSEGYEYSEGRTLFIRLPGSPASGYEWTLIPDNSGILELVDSYEIDARAKEEDPMVTAMGFFFLPAENPAGTEGSMLFTLDKAPEGEPVGTVLEFGFRLDENGELTDITRVR